MKKSLSIKNCQAFGVKNDRAKKTVTICLVPKFKTLFVGLVMILAVSSLAYIFQINRLATMGQEINGKESFLQELKEKNKDLELEVARLKSSYHFEEERKRLELANPESVSFVEIGKDDSVALAN